MNREFGSPTKSEIIVASVSESIRKGEFREGQVIPGINQASEKFQVLAAAKERIRRYNRLILSFPSKSGHSQPHFNAGNNSHFINKQKITLTQ